MIKFNTIKFKNFLSFGNNWTEIRLDEHQTTVVVGSNGAGKSTMLDAISYVLYGKAYRDINKPQLINSVNGKNCEVVIEFRVGKNDYVVRRGMKPNIFEIHENGTLVDQESRALDYQLHLEKNILQMNYIAFTQIVVLGKATYVPFMRLRPAERRQLIEELLSLTIFSKMNDVLKSRLSTTKNEKYSLDNLVSLIEEKIQLRKKYIKQLETDGRIRIQEINDQIQEYRDAIMKHEQHISEIQKLKDQVFKDVEKHKRLKATAAEMDKIDYEFTNKRKRITKKIRFLKENDVCHSCGQDIGQDYKHKKLSDYNASLEEVESDTQKLEQQIDKLNARMEPLEDAISELRKLEVTESSLLSRISDGEREIKRLTKKLSETVDGNVYEEQAELDKLSRELESGRTTRSDMNLLINQYQAIGTMLKDTGIKSVIVQKYLPIFNQLINQYLTKFDFFVKFELDETFSETILSRHKDKFSYASFSEGERLRIDLAILLTWREISKMKNAMSCNLLIMDEIFDSSLDQSGVDAFIDLIPRMENANIFVISHTPAKLYDKFKNIIEVEKDGNFSVLK